jgi:hypothetical protein
MTIAAADPNSCRIRANSRRRCTALGKIIISSNAHGSRRPATHGFPNSSDNRAAATAESYGDIDAMITSTSSISWITSTAPSIHQRDHSGCRSNHRSARARQPFASRGSGPSSLRTSVPGAISPASVSSAGVQRPPVSPGPATTTDR